MYIFGDRLRPPVQLLQEDSKKKENRMPRLFIPGLMLLLHLIFSTQIFADRTSDSLALVDLFNNTAGEAWFDAWNLTDSIDTWQGVALDAEGNVIALNLDNRNVVGKLIDLNLPRLTQFIASNNNLREELPLLTLPVSLIFLDLSDNSLSGTIPDLQLPELRTLRLSGNRFSGDIPNFSGLPSLETFVAAENMLSGGLPNFTGMSELRALRLADNDLDGPIPEMSFTPNLIILDLSDNAFIGGIPLFGAVTTLFELRLSNNQLTGFVPRFTRTPLLDVVMLDNNRLVGPVTTMGNLDFIRHLDLSDNMLEGGLEFLTRYQTLERILLNDNQFTGTLPELPEFDALQEIDVSNNFFVDTIPDYGELPSLMEIRASGNDFTAVGFDASAMINLRQVHVDNNKLSFRPLLGINGTNLNDFVYAPQQIVPMPDTIVAMLNDNVTIELPVDQGVPNNTYSWSLNDEFLIATPTNELFLPRINALDQGTYTCTVNNNFLPALALRTEAVFLLMGCPINLVEISDTICSGDTLFVNDVAYFETGVYSDTLIVNDPGTCDSVFLVDLLVNAVFETNLVDTVCASEGYLLGDTLLFVSDTYIRNLTAGNGCDSVVTLDLTVFPVSTNVLEMEICAGDTLFVGSFSHTQPGVYFDTLQTRDGCDSVIITDLNVLDSSLILTQATACFGEIFEYRGMEFSESIRYVEKYQNVLGCDSTYILELTIPTSDTHEFELTLCSADSLVFADSVFRNSGSYLDTLTSSTGCDSIVIINLNMVDNFDQDFDQVMCMGDTLFFAGDSITVAGVYVDSLTSRAGCDSLVKIRLNVLDFVSASIDTLLCFDESLIVGNSEYSTSGVYRDTLSGIKCDTVVVSRVSVLDPIVIENLTFNLDMATDSGMIAPQFTGGSGLYRYRWNTGDTTLSLNGIPAGAYTINVLDDEGCDQTFDFVLDETTASVDSETKRIAIYPNPISAGAILNIDLPGTSTWNVQLLNVLGQRIWNTSDLADGKLQLPFDLPSGTYLLQVQNQTAGISQSVPLIIH